MFDARRSGAIVSGLVGLILFQAPATAQELIDCPAGGPIVPPATISHQMFSDVCVRGNPFNPILYFDDYSWRSFLALAWPAKLGQRGQPDGSLSLGAPGLPTVFETFKAEWEVFRPNEGDRGGWSHYGSKTDNPCELDKVVFGDVLLAAFSRFESVQQAGTSGALMAQNRRYVRYSAGFNEKLFQHVLDGKYYIRQNLEQNFVPFPSGAIAIKSAWIDMQGIERPERFHTRDDTWLFDLETKRCERKKVGLVALHIVAKTPTRPQWIWSTFEHIDNVPGPYATAPFTFNNGDGTPMPTQNPIRCPCPPTAPSSHEPYNVDRLTPIYDRGSAFSTVKTNAKYRAMLARQFPNSPWKNYQLVMTQWPIPPSRPELDGRPDKTFPGTDDDKSAFSNSAMETFLQKNVHVGCMGCHNQARATADFVLTLAARAHPRRASTVPSDQ
jgi:hypothetical protein